MKRLLILLAFAVLPVARASDLPAGAAFYTAGYTNTFPALNTNAVVGTNYIGDSLHHTFYFNCPTNLNGAQYTISFSGDSANRSNWSTVSNAATSFNAYTNAAFKQVYYRVSVTGTNLGGSIIYFGGR